MLADLRLGAGIVIPKQKDGAIFSRKRFQKAVQRSRQLLAQQLRFRAFTAGDAFLQFIQQQLCFSAASLFGGIPPPAVYGKVAGKLAKK